MDYDFWIPFVACAEYLKCLDQTTYIFPVLQEEGIKSCIKSTNGSCLRKSTVTNETQS